MSDRAFGAILALALSLPIMAVWPAEPPPNPPVLLRFEGESLARDPAGPILTLPPATEVHLCAGSDGIVAIYDLASRTIRVLQPCDSLFTDGFE